jgi:hypothetical protein
MPFKSMLTVLTVILTANAWNAIVGILAGHKEQVLRTVALLRRSQVKLMKVQLELTNVRSILLHSQTTQSRIGRAVRKRRIAEVDELFRRQITATRLD